MHVLFAHGLESGPWGRKSLALRGAGHEVTSPDCRGLDLETRVSVLVEALRTADPVPIVVGSSFGGIAAWLAVAWAARSSIAVPGLVLCAPALAVPVPARWQIDPAPSCPTVILHGRRDDVVAIDDSRAFAQQHGVELIELDDDHSLSGSVDRMLAAVAELASAARPTTSGIGTTFEGLLEVVMHDLRNPLGTVQLTAELARTATTDARATRQAQRIVDNVARMVAVLEQAQQYATLLAQPHPAHGAGPTDVATALGFVVQMLRPEDRLVVEIGIAGDPVGPWDPELLTRIFTELVDNALGYRSDESAVQVRIDGTQPEQLVIEIENAGAFAAAQKADLFVPYASRKSPRPHGMRRLGLGLVLVRRWVEILGAALMIESSERRTIARLQLPRGRA